MSERELAPGPPGSAAEVEVLAVSPEGAEPRPDLVASEEPMEVRVVAEEGGRRTRHGVAVTMRTPGHDFELAAGFLFCEGIVPRREAIWRIDRCEAADEPEPDNVVEIHLTPETPFDPGRFSRNVYTTSSCGICGAGSIELVRRALPGLPAGELKLAPARLAELPAKLAAAQTVFARTGGLHAAGLFDAGGRLVLLREDVGRHNALDKVIGALLLQGALPASDGVLLVSGRASFELVQKALMGGVPVLAAVGAPSSLAVQTAEALGMTLVGFLRDGRFNVYAGAARIAA